jgi:beta-glucosidase
LSYTTFKYTHLRSGAGIARVDATNTGKRSGDEVVQLYVRRQGLKQLRGFERISLKPGETRTVEIPFKAGPGAERMVVGGSSADEKLEMAIAAAR